jgi:hypothetical protein
MSSKVWLVVLLVAVLLVGCNMSQPVTPTVTPLPTPTAAAATATVPRATAAPMPELGEVQTVPFNGFSFRPVEGWSLSTESNSVSMEAPDAGVNTGPGFFITGGNLEDFGATINGPEDITVGVIQSYISNLIPAEASYISSPRKVAVNGIAGNDLDFIVPSDTEPYRGRITVLQDGDQVFLFLGLTPPERWEEEFRPLYEQVLRQTAMIEIER